MLMILMRLCKDNMYRNGIMKVQRYNFDYPKLYISLTSIKKSYHSDVSFCDTITCLNPVESEKFLSQNSSYQYYQYRIFCYDKVIKKLKNTVPDYKSHKFRFELNVNKHSIPVINAHFDYDSFYSVIHHVYYYYRKYMNFKEFANNKDVLDYIFSFVIPNK